jgi:hypothetical protein
MAAPDARMRLPEEGWASGKQDGGFNRNPAARVPKMAAQEERWRFGKKDGRPGSRMPAGEERWRPGRLKKWPSKKDGRPGSWKSVREARTAVRIEKNGPGRENGGGEAAKPVFAPQRVAGWPAGAVRDAWSAIYDICGDLLSTDRGFAQVKARVHWR